MRDTMHLKIQIKKLILLSIFGIFYFAFLGNTHFANASILQSDLNQNGINDANEPEVVLSSNASLPAGEYFFNNLTITNNATLTLLGDPLSLNIFKGVKIIVANLTVNSGSSISADYKGYGPDQGPGASPLSSSGASYGGTSLGGNIASIYGSATAPTDLGSGGNSFGGGAIRIVVSNTFTNNGIVSADGNLSSSGGSIYVTANNITGSGKLRANGGGLYASGYFKSPGGGGRIAVYYHTSLFNGAIEVKGGCGSYDGYSPSCGQNGTAGMFDESTNDIYVNNSWQFRKNDSPFNFNNIYISNTAKVTSENGANITANNIFINNNSSFTLADNQILNIPTITVDGSSILTLSGSETITANSLIIKGNSTVTVVPGKILSLTIPNITINAGSSISADYKGYGPDQGPGASPLSSSGASYGGTSLGGALTSIYGSATKPVDFGSGGYYFGGGAIRLIVSNILTNNGAISADGNASSSGGSIYITANNITGSGKFRANGGGLFALGYFKSPGGGGRVALYYQNSSFSGIAEAKGGCGSYDGYSPSCGQSGTAGMFDESTNNLYINNSWQFRANDSPFNFNNIYISNAAKVTSESGVNITANDIVIDKNSVLTLSGNEIINADNLSVTGNSTISVVPEHTLTLTIPNITINAGSTISADAKGYLVGPGSPEIYYEAGASYGGKGGGVTAKPAYGSITAPIDFGSGTEGRRGGGAIRLIVNNRLQNDGVVSVYGEYNRTSGGSIYVTANNISGSGAFRANGSNGSWPYGRIGGGGGRIAIYYQNSSFSGVATALAGVYCFYGCIPAAENGTVVMKTSVPVCSVNCFSNILFLPGLMGSRLYDPGINCGEVVTGSECGEKETWVSTNDALQEKLALNAQGKSINNIYTKNDTQNNGELDETGIVDDVGTFNIYQSFIDDLRKWKDIDKIIADYDFIPYDWRLSLDDVITNGAASINNNLSYTNPQNFSESFILKKLEALQKNSKSGKVTIIAHSNGGLVAKALIQKLKDTNNPLYDKIDKVILIAVPQVGTPDTVVSLLHGAGLGHGLIMSADRSRQLSENMSSVYNLLPSANYFSMAQIPFIANKLVTFEDKPFFNSQISKYGLNISDEPNLKNYILGTDGRTKPSFDDTVHPNIGNSVLYNQAEAVHQILDTWQASPNTKVIQVAGWGEETLAGIDYKLYVDFWGNEYLSYKPNMVIDGDGTVVAPSALWMSDTNPNVERWWVDLKTYNKNNIPNRIHRNILEILNLRDFVKSKMKDENSFTDSSNIIVSDTSTLLSDNIRRLRYTLHSPLTLGITDAQGRYTGQDPVTKEIKEEIPNITYRQIGDVQFISAPTDISYILEMHGYQEGSFALDVDKQEGNNITGSTSFQGIPSSTSTIATMDIAQNQEIENSTLKIDQNGDEIIDKTLNATPDGITIYDVTPPEISISYNIEKKEVVFSAVDISPATISHSNTNITAIDDQNNTSILYLTKYKEKPTKLKVSFNTIVRNGISTIFPNTNIQHDWKEKKGVLTDLDTRITIKGVEKYIFNYKKSNNTTVIKQKIGSTVTKTTRQGFVSVTIKTNGDSIKVDY